jgi:hypothetical protein
MTSTTRHVSEFVDRPAQVVHDYVADPANLPEWAPGLLGSAVLERVDGGWAFESADGRVLLELVQPNELGVVDHWVTFPSGERFYNPMRVTPDGDGAEVDFAVRRARGVSDADFDRDVAAVAADLASIKRVLEARPL